MDFSIEEYVSRHPKLNLRASGHSNYRGWCPFQGPSGEYDCFSINVETGEWLCRSSRCQLRGGFALFYKMLEDIKLWRDVYRVIKKAGRPFTQASDFDQLLVRDTRVNQHTVPEWPAGALQVTALNPYLARRRYSQELFDTGFSFWTYPLGLLKNRLILPYFDVNNEFTTYTARSMIDGLEPRYWHASEDMGHFLFGEHRINHVIPQRIILVEGQFDVLRLVTLGEFALGISGSSITDHQLSKLMWINQVMHPEFIVMLDQLAESAQAAIYGEMVSVGLRTRQAFVGNYAKDPDGLDAESLARVLDDVYADQQ